MNKPIEKPHGILMHLVQDGCGPPSIILAHAKSLDQAIESDQKEYAKTIEDKLNRAIKTLEYYEYGPNYNENLIDADGKGMHSEMDRDRGSNARRILDEIKSGSITLCGKKT